MQSHMFKKTRCCRSIRHAVSRFGWVAIFMMLSSVALHAQTVTLNVRQATVNQIFEAIKQQTGFAIWFKQGDVNLNEKVTLNVKQIPVREALELTLKGQAVSISIKDKYITITKNDPPKGRILPEVTGAVVDAKKEPIIGATVQVKGTTMGMITDVNGNFSLKNIPSNAILLISYVGYNPQEVAVDGKTNLHVVLQENSQQLNEVVVTALGITKEKKALGYSLQEVSGKELTQDRDPNLLNAMSGKVAGVDIQQAATGPAGSSRITIRGNNSIGGNNQPLVVVDGVPINSSTGGTNDFWGNRSVDMGSGIADISPDDVESISVLKGPAAAALYGSLAGNGVVMITTKKGHTKGLGVSYNSNLTFDNPMQTPSFQNVYGQGSGGVFDVNQQGSWGGKMDGSVVHALMGDKAYSPTDNNLYKDFLHSGTTFTNNVDFNYGTDHSTMRASITRLDNNNVIPNSGFNRTSFDLRSTSTLSKFLSTDFKINYINDFIKNAIKLASDPDNIFLNYLMMPRSVGFSDYQKFAGTNYAFTQFGGPATYIPNMSGYSGNPYWSAYRNTNQQTKNRLIGFASTKITFAEWMDLRLRYGLDYSDSQFQDRLATGTPYWATGSYTGDFRVINQSNWQSNADFLLSLHHTFDKLGLSGAVGGNMMYTKATYQIAQANGLVIPELYTITNGSNRKGDYTFNQKQINSLYATASLAWDNYLYVDLSARNDWSSTLPQNNRSYFYPSIGGSFIFTQLLSNHGISTGPLSFGKLRASWAQVGNDASPYMLSNYYSIDFSNNVLNVTPQNYIANPNLKPEKINSWEIGTTLNFFNNRIGLDVDYYKKNDYNQILQIAQPPATGYQYKLINAGNIQNDGFEVALNATPIRVTNGFEWDMNLNLSKNNNKVVALDPTTDEQIISDQSISFLKIVAHVGGAYGDIYGYAYQRDAKGNILIDNNGIPLRTTSMQRLGNNQPNFMAGFSNSFSYKNFSMSFLVDSRFGGKVYMGSIQQGTYYGTLAMTLNGRSSMVVPGIVQSSGAVNTIATNAQQYWTGISGITEAFLYDATNIRLREFTFGYTLPKSLLEHSPIQSVKASFVARNLFMIYSRTKGYDPDAAYTTGNAQGVEYGSMPTLRTLGFNINVVF